jgi:hypothetical protein
MKIELNETQKELILENLNEKGRLPCVKALSLARELKIDPKSMVDITDELQVKIGECELGVFGDRPLGDVDNELYSKILTFSDENKKVECPKLWEEAKNSTMQNVRSTVKQTDIFVTYCQLGCFNEGKRWMRK